MGPKSPTHARNGRGPAGSLAAFACPDPDCPLFNRFDAGNLSVVEYTGKHKDIRRLYCSACKRRFSERQGTLLRYSKLPEEAVVRIVKCLGHGCSVEATADICDVDPCTVGRILEQAGRRAEDFHRLQLDRLEAAPEAVQLDEPHGRVSPEPAKEGAPIGSSPRTDRGRGRGGVAAAATHPDRVLLTRSLGVVPLLDERRAQEVPGRPSRPAGPRPTAYRSTGTSIHGVDAASTSTG